MRKSLVYLIAFPLIFAMSCNGPVKNESEQSSESLYQEQSQQPEETPQAEALAEGSEQASVASPAAQDDAPPLLNPPHGQPYHRCDIPVGSPLPTNGSPQATASQAATPAPATVDRSMIPTVENANRINGTPGRQATAASGTPPRLNPPHGQPFHRCDIPVGSPLPLN